MRGGVGTEVVCILVSCFLFLFRPIYVPPMVLAFDLIARRVRPSLSLVDSDIDVFVFAHEYGSLMQHRRTYCHLRFKADETRLGAGPETFREFYNEEATPPDWIDRY